jgi:hypothetical protein
MALSNIGHRSSIASLSEASSEAQAVNLWYDWSRLQALAAYDWSFARKRIALTTHSEDPPDGVWGYRYQYPADCLVAREIENPSGERSASGIVRLPSSFSYPDPDAIPFVVEVNSDGSEKTIFSDLAAATVIYTFDQQTTGMFTPFFVELLAFLIAHHIAFTLTGKRTLSADMLQKYQMLLLQAPAVDANEQVSPPPRDSDIIRGRR